MKSKLRKIVFRLTLLFIVILSVGCGIKNNNNDEGENNENKKTSESIYFLNYKPELETTRKGIEKAYMHV